MASYTGNLTVPDAADFLEPWTGACEHDALIYLDPPYFVKGEGLYDNFYEAADHAQVAEVVMRLTQPWIVSYDADPEIINLYKDNHQIRYSLNYSANRRGRGTEVMFFSSQLTVPQQLPHEVSTTALWQLRAQPLLL